MRAFWTTYAHRAYPWFINGNRHLLDALDGDFNEPAELDCALIAYKRALSFLVNPSDNPELFGAIMNNTGIAFALQGYLEGDLESVQNAKAHFLRAEASSGYKNSFHLLNESARSGTRNLVVLSKFRRMRAVKNQILSQEQRLQRREKRSK